MPEVLRTEIVGARSLARPDAVLDPATAELLAAEFGHDQQLLEAATAAYDAELETGS